MRHEGKASRKGHGMILWSLLGVLAVAVVGVLVSWLGAFMSAVGSLLLVLWLMFAAFCLWFFRDPTPRVPAGEGVVVAPAFGKVDVIDETTEPEWMEGPCRRISIFLSVFDVHVQYAPLAARVRYRRHRAGEFLNAMNLEAASRNENVLYGFALEPAEIRFGVRLIAGLIARRIVPWAEKGETVAQGERIGLIQFGSRVEIYLPLDAEVRVRVGDRVRGGETVVAQLG